jgi:hypothetical protein
LPTPPKLLHGSPVRLRPHALADNLPNILRTLALPEAVKHWSLTALRKGQVKIGAKVVPTAAR